MIQHLPAPLLVGIQRGAARRRLWEYRKAYGAQDSQTWFKHCTHAIKLVRQTFPVERRESALRDYSWRYCEGQVAVVIAIHTISLELWAADNRERRHGSWLEAACQACDLAIEALPENREDFSLDTPLSTPRTTKLNSPKAPPKKHELPPKMKALQEALEAGKLAGPLDLGYLKHPDVRIFTRRFLEELEQYGPKHTIGRAALHNLMLVITNDKNDKNDKNL